MKKIAIIGAVLLMTGCVFKSSHIDVKEAPVARAEQKHAQQEMLKKQPVVGLKRKVAIGRITNETTYGRSLLRDEHGDPLGKQVSDMVSARLVESGQFVVLERPDLDRIEKERVISGTDSELVGVDTLIVGSLTEFGRNITGRSGFLSSTKKQTAVAKVEVRLVNVKTGQAYFSATGSGEATAEAGAVLGFGAKAGYDGTLTDRAISNAISDVIDGMISNLNSQPWKTSILHVEDGLVYISGGNHQGLRPGKELTVKQLGKQVKSAQTGFTITLPGKEVARIQIDSNFGETETTEGSVAHVVSGNIAGLPISSLEVVE
ncbi:CsgG/HfaB family protein [Endozoicomonas sp. Mp262]|uniref:CsgG/HfaB family protein n=1 Tax=Endozoicomonas sp. Mp262 TaxID=2919499 RepID=UPI0021D98B8A